ncbi:MAG: copper homeostasis protein CutC [Candidatus Hodarchaeota archaeon]
MKEKIKIEVCCGSVDDAILSESAGADRIELNSSLFFGGLTPSIGAIIETKKRLKIPVMVMIRPRGGGFCYTEAEIKSMEYDIEVALANKADGVVFGVLNKDGTINLDVCNQLINKVSRGELVFHRAFDVVPDMTLALEQIIDLGFDRILTTGLKRTVEEGADNIRKLIELAGDRIQILPGGVNLYNAREIVAKMGCNQIHIASFVTRTDNSTMNNRVIFYGAALYPPENQYDLIDGEFVKKMRSTLNE